MLKLARNGKEHAGDQRTYVLGFFVKRRAGEWSTKSANNLAYIVASTKGSGAKRVSAYLHHDLVLVGGALVSRAGSASPSRGDSPLVEGVLHLSHRQQKLRDDFEVPVHRSRAVCGRPAGSKRCTGFNACARDARRLGAGFGEKRAAVTSTLGVSKQDKVERLIHLAVMACVFGEAERYTDEAIIRSRASVSKSESVKESQANKVGARDTVASRQRLFEVHQRA